MATDLWTPETIKHFWEKNQASFAGDVDAPEIIRQTKQFIQGKILDVGAGSGALIRLLPGAVGVDIAPKNSAVLQGCIEALPFANKSFDTVFATDILEHLPTMALQMGISEVLRVLKPGGCLIATVPNQEDLKQSMVLCPCCQTEFHRRGHVNWFDEHTMRDLLKEFDEVLVKALPLGLMAEYWPIRYFWRIFLRMGFFKASELLVVAIK